MGVAVELIKKSATSCKSSCCAPFHDAGNVIERHEHAGDFKEWSAQKMFAIIGSVGHPKAIAATKWLAMETEHKDINIKVMQSVWRRMKKGHVKVRDLQPVKDVKGGGGVAGNSRSSTGGTGGIGQYTRH